MQAFALCAVCSANEASSNLYPTSGVASLGRCLVCITGERAMAQKLISASVTAVRSFDLADRASGS